MLNKRQPLWPCALELPDVLLRAIRVTVAGRGRRESSDIEERIAGVRNRVPEKHRAEFDELLGEARLTYRIRDERGVFSDIWAYAAGRACWRAPTR